MFHASKIGPQIRTSMTVALLVSFVPFAFAAGQARAQGHTGMQMDSTQPQGEKAAGVGTVNSVNAAERKLNLSHEPIPAIKWPSMTMDFPAASSVDLSQVKPGAKVRFNLIRGANGTYTVDSISPMP